MPGGRCGFRYHPGPKQDLLLRTPGMHSKTANMNQGSRSSEDHPIQSKAVFSLNQNYLYGCLQSSTSPDNYHPVLHSPTNWVSSLMLRMGQRRRKFSQESVSFGVSFCALEKVVSPQVNNTTFLFNILKRSFWNFEEFWNQIQEHWDPGLQNWNSEVTIFFA